MKKSLSLFLLCLVFSLAISQETPTSEDTQRTFVELSPLPADPRFDQVVTFSTGLSGAPLAIMIEALAKTVGLDAIIANVPEDAVTYDFGEKPFRQIWEVILSLNGLDYILQKNDVVVVGTIDSILRYHQREPIVDPAIEQNFYTVSGNTEEFATALRAADPQLIVEAIPNINTLSVRGTKTQQEAVKSILEDLDPPLPKPEQEPKKVQRIYRLSNAKAEDIVNILREAALAVPPSENAESANQDAVAVSETDTSRVSRSVPALNPAVEEALRRNAAAQESEQVETPDFTIVADERTNSLIINATVEQHEQFTALLPKLDIAQKQVNVQVRIQEISKDSATNLGIDLNAGFGSFTAQFLEAGLNFVFNAQKAISGLNIGAVLDTLERQGFSRKVDDANVTVLNNEKGSIQSGGTIFITLVAADVAIEREIPYGVQIDVEPQITNTGLVNLQIEAKLEATVGNVSDPTLLNLSTKRVTSNVTLEPGQTILLGGLFHNSFAKNIKGVPILSSIPIIGEAFKHTSVEEEDTELLLIVTANIIE